MTRTTIWLIVVFTSLAIGTTFCSNDDGGGSGSDTDTDTDTGTTGDGAIGDPCDDDFDCATNHCLSDYPEGGCCVQECPCPDGTECLSISETGPWYCFAGCEADTECRIHYDCYGGGCLPDCTQSPGIGCADYLGEECDNDPEHANCVSSSDTDTDTDMDTDIDSDSDSDTDTDTDTATDTGTD